MAKKKVYEPGNVASAAPETVTVADTKFRAGDRVQWKGRRAFGLHGVAAGEIVGVVRSIKKQGALTYAVIAAEPYGQLYMPPLMELVRREERGDYGKS